MAYIQYLREVKTPISNSFTIICIELEFSIFSNYPILKLHNNKTDMKGLKKWRYQTF